MRSVFAATTCKPYQSKNLRQTVPLVLTVVSGPWADHCF